MQLSDGILVLYWMNHNYDFAVRIPPAAAVRNLQSAILL